MAEFIPRPQHGEGDSRQNCEAGRNHDQAGLWCNVRCPEKAVPEPVNHVEKRVEVRKRLPEGRQGVNRVEDARKEGERHDDEVLKRRQLVELVGPDSRNQTQGAEYRAAEQRKRRQPQGARTESSTNHTVTANTPNPTIRPRATAAST